jgi:hypothetical protein
MFNGAGTPHPAKSADGDDDSNASAAHGDRVIALGLCCLAMKYQAKASIERQKAKGGNSLGTRMQERKLTRLAKKAKRFLY